MGKSSKTGEKKLKLYLFHLCYKKYLSKKQLKNLEEKEKQQALAKIPSGMLKDAAFELSGPLSFIKTFGQVPCRMIGKLRKL